MAGIPTVYTLGKGSVLSVSTDGTSFTPVKQLKSITFSGSEQAFDTITNLDSPGAVHEFAPTLITPPDCDFQGVFNGADPGQIMVSAAFDAQQALQCKLQLAPGKGQTTGMLRTFTAFVKSKPQIDAQMDKASTYSGSLKITGQITDTPAS